MLARSGRRHCSVAFARLSSLRAPESFQCDRGHSTSGRRRTSPPPPPPRHYVTQVAIFQALPAAVRVAARRADSGRVRLRAATSGAAVATTGGTVGPDATLVSRGITVTVAVPSHAPTGAFHVGTTTVAALRAILRCGLPAAVVASQAALRCLGSLASEFFPFILFSSQPVSVLAFLLFSPRTPNLAEIARCPRSPFL